MPKVFELNQFKRMSNVTYILASFWLKYFKADIFLKISVAEPFG